MSDRWISTRTAALAPHLLLAGLGWLQTIVLLVVAGAEIVANHEGLVLWPIALDGAFLFGIPALIYAWLLIRWWRTGRWRALATADAVIALLAGWSLIGSVTSSGRANPMIPVFIATTAILGILFLIAIHVDSEDGSAA